jgi:hypothetical protein
MNTPYKVRNSRRLLCILYPHCIFVSDVRIPVLRRPVSPDESIKNKGILRPNASSAAVKITFFTASEESTFDDILNCYLAEKFLSIPLAIYPVFSLPPSDSS